MTSKLNSQPNTAMTQDRYLTLAEVREMFKVSRSTLWRWTSERGLRTTKIGGVSRIRESDLQRFLNGGEPQHPPAARTASQYCDLCN